MQASLWGVKTGTWGSRTGLEMNATTYLKIGEPYYYTDLVYLVVIRARI